MNLPVFHGMSEGFLITKMGNMLFVHGMSFHELPFLPPKNEKSWGIFDHCSFVKFVEVPFIRMSSGVAGGRKKDLKGGMMRSGM